MVVILLERRERTSRSGRWVNGSREERAVRAFWDRERVVRLVVDKLDGMFESLFEDRERVLRVENGAVKEVI